MNNHEDEVLVRGFKEGDEKAFDQLFEKYQRVLYSLCYRFSRNDSDAGELVQDIFIKVYRNLKKFNERSKFFTWLYRIAINTCISYKRKQKRELPMCNQQAQTLSVEGRVMMKIAISDALLQLPDRQRMSFVLHHYEGYTYDEVGRIMGITTGAAKANHHQAVKKLRVLLKDWL